MPRSINFTSGPECAQNNPYFTVRTIVPERYFYEYLEELILGEFGILPEKSKGYNLSFQDYPQLADLFNVVGVNGDITLTFTDNIVIFDLFEDGVKDVTTISFLDFVSTVDQFVFSLKNNTTISFLDFVSTLDQLGLAGTATRNLIFNDSIALGDQKAEYVQRYSGSACEIYVDRVESDGGEVIDVTGVCQALTYFNSTPTTGYKLNFTESLSIMTFEAIVSGVRKTYNFAFIDSVDTEDEFTDRRSRNIFLNFTEILDLAASN
jgi:hypothetical protein